MKHNILSVRRGAFLGRVGIGTATPDSETVVLPGTGDRTNTLIEAEVAIKGPSRFYRVKVIP